MNSKSDKNIIYPDYQDCLEMYQCNGIKNLLNSSNIHGIAAISKLQFLPYYKDGKDLYVPILAEYNNQLMFIETKLRSYGEKDFDQNTCGSAFYRNVTKHNVQNLKDLPVHHFAGLPKEFSNSIQSSIQTWQKDHNIVPEPNYKIVYYGHKQVMVPKMMPFFESEEQIDPVLPASYNSYYTNNNTVSNNRANVSNFGSANSVLRNPASIINSRNSARSSGFASSLKSSKQNSFRSF